MYAHLPCSILFLFWAFHFHLPKYYSMRNGFFIAHFLTILIEVLYCCAPPRLLKDYDFVDTIMLYSKKNLLEMEKTTGNNFYLMTYFLFLFRYKSICGYAFNAF